MTDALKNNKKVKSLQQQFQQGAIDLTQYLRALCDVQKDKIINGEL